MVAYDLMDEYDRDEVRSRSRRHHLGTGSQERREVVIPPLVIQPGERLALTPTTDVILGDRVEMARQHIGDGEIDVAVLDLPFYLGPAEENVVDYYLELNGEKPRFREDWDNFASLADLKSSVTRQSMRRCAASRQRLAVYPRRTHQYQYRRPLATNKGIHIINQISWVKRNSRPHICQRRLQHCNEWLIWAAEKTRRNIGSITGVCKMHYDPRDYFSERGRQMGMSGTF